jgi:hypothetical protein
MTGIVKVRVVVESVLVMTVKLVRLVVEPPPPPPSPPPPSPPPPSPPPPAALVVTVTVAVTDALVDVELVLETAAEDETTTSHPCGLVMSFPKSVTAPFLA